MSTHHPPAAAADPSGTWNVSGAVGHEDLRDYRRSHPIVLAGGLRRAGDYGGDCASVRDHRDV